MKKKTRAILWRRLGLLATKCASAGIFIEISIASVSVFLVAIFVTLEAILRYVFSTSIFGLEEFTLIIAVYAYFVGSAYASKDNAQIRVNIIDLVPMPSRARQVINIAMGFIAFIVCSIFAYFAFGYCQWLLAADLIISPLEWPLFVAAFSILLGMGLMGVHHLVQFVQSLQKA